MCVSVGTSACVCSSERVGVELNVGQYDTLVFSDVCDTHAGIRGSRVAWIFGQMKRVYLSIFSALE